MGLIVQKFGGTSVASIDRIKAVTQIIKAEIDHGHQVIVVVSAMAGVTNQLIALCQQVSKLYSAQQLAEYDAALSSGEVVVASLLALSLQAAGINARSVLAWQLPIITNDHHSMAVVQKVGTVMLHECLKQAVIPVIAGFQGIDNKCRITTLGRGGSDTTAALVATIMQADLCQIYSDVAGVFTSDPKIVSRAQPLKQINFEEMLEFSESGAKILHPRCVAIAMRYNLPVKVLSSFTPDQGTLITSQRIIMENRVITGITSNQNLLKVCLDSPQLSFNQLGSLLSKNNIQIKLMLNLEISTKYRFLVTRTDHHRLTTILDDLKNHQQISDFKVSCLSMISVIGYGINHDISLVGSILDKLTEQAITVSMLQTSEIKLCLILSDDDNNQALNILHEFFALDKIN